MQYDEFAADVDSITFNDSPVHVSTVVTSGTMDTSNIDAYRQGTEIRTQRHYSKGTVKILSGDPGHVLSRCNYGAGANVEREVVCADKDRFDPVVYLSSQSSLDELAFTVTFPIEVGDNDQVANINLNGILEPLTIRDIAAFTSIESPYVSHDVRGSLMSGNEDETFASERLLSIDEFAPTYEQTSYVDMVDMMNGTIPLDGTFNTIKASLPPYVDERPIRNASPLSGSFTDIVAALSHMTGSTDNYVRHGMQCASTGFSFHNDGIGVDSIAFGELSY